MAVPPRIEIVEKYLDNPKDNFFTNSDQDGISTFFFSLLGDLFIQGYRVFENISNRTIILSLMQYTFISPASNPNVYSDLPQYKIINFEKDVILDKIRRAEIFKSLLETAECIDGTVEINIIYLKSQKMSVMNKYELEQSRQPDSRPFFKPSEFLPEKRGYKHIDVKAQGTRLHGAIEFYLKGNGSIPNFSAFKRDITGNQQEIKFEYDLNKVINTLKMIVGKEIFANDYWIMNAEKWMRKKTKKNFKRFDLILRNESKICIIDWKFSKNKADEKINKRSFVKKNRLYFELAKNDYKADVELKFYCIHLETINDHYHKCTEASYVYKIDEITLDNQEDQQGADDSSEEIVFYEDKETQKRMIEQANFFESTQTQEKSQQCLQEFKQKFGILDQKNKIQDINKMKEEVMKVVRSIQKQKQKISQRFFADEEYQPGKNFQIESSEQLRRGKRSKPVEIIEHEKKRQPIMGLIRKKIKLNQSTNQDDAISISSIGQGLEDEQIEILPAQLNSMELKDEKKIVNKPLYFDLKEIEKQVQNRYLTLIERPIAHSIVENTMTLQVSKPELHPTGPTNPVNNYKANKNQLGIEEMRNLSSKSNYNSEEQIISITATKTSFKDKPIRSIKQNEELLKCFEDEEEQKINSQPIENNSQNHLHHEMTEKQIQIMKTIHHDEIEQEKANKTFNLSFNKSTESNKLDKRNQLNTDALRRGYQREQKERQKKNCSPKQYIVLDSDEQYAF